MKVSKYLVSALVCAALVGCSQDEDLSTVDLTEETSVSFNFQTMDVNSDLNTRAETAETSGEEEVGTAEEYSVNKVRIYMFDSGTKNFIKTLLVTNLTEDNPDGNYIVYRSQKILVNPGTYDIYAVANTDKVIAANNESQFLNNVDAETYQQGEITSVGNGIVMSNRGNSLQSKTIEKSLSESTIQTVSINLERSVARLEVAKSKDIYELKNSSNEVYAYVNLSGCYFLNLPTSYYSFRHVAEMNSLSEPSSWTIDDNFCDVKDGNGYVCDPYFFNKVSDSSMFTNNDGFYANYIGEASAAAPAFKSLTKNYADNKIYALENCMFQNCQKTRYSTSILFKSELTPNNNVLKLVGDNLVAVAESEYPDILYYFNYKFYTSLQAIKKAGANIEVTMSEDELLERDVKLFQGNSGKFTCYYTYIVRHLNNNDPTVMGVMEFGIVRNNLYRMKVTDLTGLGSGKIIDGPDDDESETYIKIKLNVKPWTVRKQEDIKL